MKMLRITLEGKTYDVGVEELPLTDQTVPATPHVAPVAAPAPPAAPVAVARAVPAGPGGKVVTSPMAGHVFKCLVKRGDAVTVNQVVVVLDAMKMETPVVSPFAGTVLDVLAREGDSVDEGHPLVQIGD